jgi:hypothetical protein
MSGVAIVRALLASTPAITALVPASRIIAGFADQALVRPLITVTQVSASEVPTVGRRLSVKMIRERVQVTVLADKYLDLKKIMKAAALGAGVHGGVVVGIVVKSVMPENVGPEIPPGDDKIFEQSRDFMVTFVEAN